MAARVAEALTIEHALLGFVREEPRHGYAIYQELTDPAGLWVVWRIKQSQLYALLSKLEDRGYLAASVEPQEGRPPRKVYHLTPAGEEAFRAWLERPVEHGRQLRMDFMAKLYFARREGAEAVAALIDRQRATCQQWLDGFEGGRERSREAPPFPRLVAAYRAGQIEAMLRWLDACMEALTT